MKKTWHTVFLILLICLDAALLLLPLLPGYRALFDIGPYPGRPPAFRFLKLAGYALFFPLTAYGCGRRWRASTGPGSAGCRRRSLR